MKKFDRNYIFYHLVFDFFALLFILFFFFIENIIDSVIAKDNLGKLILIFIALFVSIYTLMTVYNVFFVKTSGYELKDSEVVCKRGVLFKKHSILEYKKIHAVNKKQNIIQKLFKIAVLTLDSGSTNTSHLAEIVIYEKESVVDELIKKIKLKQENPDSVIETTEILEHPTKENLYKFSSKTKFIYSLINVVASLFILLFITVCVLALFTVLYITVKEKVAGTLGVVLLVSLISCLGICLFSFILSIISAFVGYYDFKVYKSSKDIEINYGLLVKNSNTFKLNKIKGVVISQGIIKRLFKYVTVKLEVIGYNGQSGENNNQNQAVSTGILFPLCKESELESNLSKVLPSYVPKKKENSSVKFFPYISWSLFFLSIFFALTTGICELVFLVLKLRAIYYFVLWGIALLSFAVIILIIALNNYLAYKNNGITITNDTICVYNGGFTRYCTIIKTKNLIAIENITTPLREKRGIYSFNVHYHTNATTNVVKLNIVDKSLVEKLNSLLEY